MSTVQADEEILSYTVSDEALEAAALDTVRSSAARISHMRVRRPTTRRLAGFTHDDPTDRPSELFAGTNSIYTGGPHQSYLLLPILPSR